MDSSQLSGWELTDRRGGQVLQEEGPCNATVGIHGNHFSCSPKGTYGYFVELSMHWGRGISKRYKNCWAQDASDIDI